GRPRRRSPGPHHGGQRHRVALPAPCKRGFERIVHARSVPFGYIGAQSLPGPETPQAKPKYGKAVKTVCIVLEKHASVHMGGAELQADLLARELSARDGVRVVYLARDVPPAQTAAR